MPATIGGGWGGSAPAQGNNYEPAQGNNLSAFKAYESTPVDYEPYSPTSWEGDHDAQAKDDRIPPVESFTLC